MNDVKKSNTTFKLSSRLLALFLTLAMIVGVVPAAFAVDGEGHLKGGVRYTTTSSSANISEISVGENFTFYGVFNTLAATENFDFTGRMYLTMDGVPNSDIFQYIQIPRFTDVNGNITHPSVSDATHDYTLAWDGTNGAYYIQINKIHPGGTDTIGFDAVFMNGKSVDGNSLTITLNEVVYGTDNQPTGEVKVIDHVNYPNPATITAKAEPSLTNSKSVDRTSIAYDPNAAALPYDLTYTVNVNPANAGTAIQTGDSQINSYTVTDVITLPDGLTYEGTVSDLTLPTYNSTAVISADKKTITVTWTTTNGSAGYQASNQSYNIKLPGDKVAIGSGFTTGEIDNSVSTDYTYEGWVVENGTGSKDDITKTSNTATAATFITQDGTGLSNASKVAVEGQNYASGSGGISWGTKSPWGFAIEGDVIKYTISFTNDSSNAATYTISDIFKDYGLTYAGIDSVVPNWQWRNDLGANVSDYYIYTNNASNKQRIYENNKTLFAGEGNVNFEITLASKATASITLLATVNALGANETSKIIENQATITKGNVSATVKAQQIEERKGTPKLTITKDAKQNNTSITGYEAGDEFDYVITLTNTGTAVADDVDFSDVLPAGLVLNGGNYTISKNGGEAQTAAVSSSQSGSGATVYSVAIEDQTMARGETWTITIPVKVVSTNIPSTISNDASATYNTGETDGATPDPNPVRETVTANKTLVDKTLKTTDLDITKTANVSTVKAGGEIIYTITITNSNQYYSYDFSKNPITITDLPVGTGLTIEECTISSSYGTASVDRTNNNAVVTIDKGTIGTNTSITFTVTAKVEDNFTPIDGTGSVTNKAVITNGKEATATTKVEGTEHGSIEVTKTAYVNGQLLGDPAYVAAGDEITFRVRVTNISSQDLKYFKVVDVLAGKYDSNGLNRQLTMKIYKGSENSSRQEFIGSSSGRNYNPYTENFYWNGTTIEFQYNETDLSENPANIKQQDAVLHEGEYIEYEYTATAYSDVSNPSWLWDGGSNKVTVYDSGNNPQGDSTVTYYTPAPAPTAAPTAAPTQDPNATANPTDAPQGLAIQVTKTATYVGNDGLQHNVINDVSEVPAGNEITFKVTLKNTGTTTIKRYVLTDLFDGRSVPAGSKVYVTVNGTDGKVMQFANGGSVENKELTTSKQTWGGSEGYFANSILVGMNPSDCSGNEVYIWPSNALGFKNAGNENALPNVSVSPGESIEFIYTVTTDKGDWLGDDPDRDDPTGTNTAQVDVVDENNDTDFDWDMISYKRGEPSSISNAVLTLDKDANITTSRDTAADINVSSKKTTQVMQQENGDILIDYNIVLTNTSQEDYTTTDAKFTDVLPNGSSFFVPVNGQYSDNNKMIYVKVGDNEYKTLDDESSSYIVTAKADNVVLTTKAQKAYANSSYKGYDEYGNIYTWTAVYSDFLTNNGLVSGLTSVESRDSGTPPDDISYSQTLDANKIEVSFPGSITIPVGKSIKIKYKLIVPAAQVDAFYASAMNPSNDAYGKTVEEQNEITFKAASKFHKEDGTVSDQIAASETVDLIPPIIHPGVSKEYVGYTQYNASGITASRPKTHDDTVWRVTIYNGLDGNGTTMTNYVLKDFIPEGYTYKSTAYDGVKAANAGIKDRGYIFKYDYSAGTTTMIDEEPLALTGNDNVMDFSGSNYALDPGDRLIVYIVAEEDGHVDYGHYTNIAKVIPGQRFIADNVSVGAYEDYTSDDGSTYVDAPAVAASASVEILKLDTLGTKSVTSNGSTVSGSAQAPNNMVKASLGSTVTYDLVIANNEGKDGITDFAVIDRLPYVGDAAVASNVGRGSAFAVQYIPNSMTATISIGGQDIDVTNYIDVKYAVDTTIESAKADGKQLQFTEADADWSVDVTNKGGRVTWTDTYTSSTNLVRFCLKPDLSSHANASSFIIYYDANNAPVYGIPHGETIKIHFNAKIPDSVEEMGKSHAAWNSYAYYYNGQTYQDMISEPPMVGVYVDEDVTGGRILVRKIYKSSLTTTPVTFYFSCFEGPYDPDVSWAKNEERLKGVKPLTMMGNKNGAQAELYFTNLDIDPDGNNITYYIYESDSTGKPLEAGTVYVAGKDSKGNPTTVGSAAESTIEKNASGDITGVTEPEVADANQIYFKKATVGGDVTVPFIMDNGNKPDDKQNQQKQASNQKMENSKYFVWNKDLSVNKKENSAIFNNFYYPDAEVKVFGPLYADVPMDNTGANAKDYMTSTRPNTFENFSTETGRLDDQYATKSTERDEDSKKYDARIDGYGGDGVHYHTIATGFIAKVTGTDTYGIQNVKWTVTSTPASNPNINTVPVLVRLRTDVVGSGNSSEVNEATVLYLDDFMVMNDAPTAEERRSEFNGDIAAMDGEAEAASASDEIGFDGEDAIETIDDIYLSNYSIEERAAFIAESLSIDPANIQWDDFGTPYVIMDEQLESQALYVSGSAELNDLKDPPSKIESLKGSQSETNSGNMKGIKAYTEFGDYEKNKAGDSYAIYQLDPAAGRTYSWTINDDLPMTTLSEGSEVYLGLIIDQLYDQYAHAEVKLEADPPKADAVNVGSVVAPKANGTGNSDGEKGHLRYTDVDTPYFTSKFVKTKILSKLTKGSHYFIKFDPTNWMGVTDVDGSALSDDTNAMLIANKAVSLTDNKAITINGNAFTGHTYLSGAGSSSSCSAMINANPGDKLNVYALSSSTEATRTLRIIYIDTNGKEKKVDFTDAVMEAAGSGTTEKNITPVQWTVPENAKGPVYICSKSSGMYLYAIDVNPSN